MVGKFNFFGSLFSGSKGSADGSAKPKAQKGRGYYLELVEDTDDLANVGTEASPVAEKPQPVSPPPAPAPLPAAQEAPPAPKPEAEAQPTPPKKSIAKTPVPAAASAPSGPSTFAPNFLLPLSNNADRRRPGPSLNPFMEMARQVKRPE